MEKVKNLCIIQARMGLTRLPGRVLLKINNKSIIELIVEKLRRSRLINRIVLITNSGEQDKLLSAVFY